MHFSTLQKPETVMKTLPNIDTAKPVLLYRKSILRDHIYPDSSIDFSSQ